MDPGKVRAVVDCPPAYIQGAAAMLLGFANFNRRGYSTLASPLSALTSPNVPFTWSPVVDRAFRDLKHHFTTAPILIHPGGGQWF